MNHKTDTHSEKNSVAAGLPVGIAGSIQPERASAACQFSVGKERLR